MDSLGNHLNFTQFQRRFSGVFRLRLAELRNQQACYEFAFPPDDVYDKWQFLEILCSLPFLLNKLMPLPLRSHRSQFNPVAGLVWEH